MQGSPEFLCLRPGSTTEPRYLQYLTLSRPWLDHAELTSYGTKMPRTSWDLMGGLQISNLGLREQRRIADFLDDRVARIDQIITARRRQFFMVQAHKVSALEELILASGGAVRPLQTLTDPARPIQYGIVLPGPDVVGGVPIIKGGDIGSGRLDRLELNRTDPEIERAYMRSRVRPGDLVIAIRGSVGEVAVVPDDLAMANLTQDSARIASHECDPAWLRAVIESPGVQALMSARITGSTVKGINIQDLRKIPVPVPEVREQREVGAMADVLRETAAEHLTGLHQSITLMQEYKQSLITAAVTGEIDVATAGSGIRG